MHAGIPFPQVWAWRLHPLGVDLEIPLGVDMDTPLGVGLETPRPDPSTSPLGVGLETCKACWDTTPPGDLQELAQGPKTPRPISIK